MEFVVVLLLLFLLATALSPDLSVEGTREFVIDYMNHGNPDYMFIGFFIIVGLMFLGASVG